MTYGSEQSPLLRKRPRSVFFNPVAATTATVRTSPAPSATLALASFSCSACSFASSSRACCTFCNLNFACFSRRTLNSILPLPFPRLSLRCNHLPASSVPTSIFVFPRRSSNVRRSESNTSNSRERSASPSVKENHSEFQTGFRLLSMVEVRNFLPPAETMTYGSEASPPLLKKPRSVFRKSEADKTATVRMSPAPCSALALASLICSACSFSSCSRACCALSILSFPCFSKRTLNSISPFPSPRLCFISVHLPAASVPISTWALPRESSKVSQSESKASSARDFSPPANVKENSWEFHTGFKLLSMTAVRSFCLPTDTTTYGSEASPLLLNTPRSVFLSPLARATTMVMISPAPSAALALAACNSAACCFSSFSRAASAFCLLVPPCLSKRILSSISPLPSPRLCLHSIHLPAARDAKSIFALPSRSSKVSKSESKTSSSRD
mmetsp:Transcript_24075/g.69023  ORF Transcript_24075/g.69023 Transcript_24075/m.69023 type:complete len:443 (-) Transcript_24075:330-1658(-)